MRAATRDIERYTRTPIDKAREIESDEDSETSVFVRV